MTIEATFPTSTEPTMTRRQWLAGLAMQGTISKLGHSYLPLETLALISYDIADALLAFEENELAERAKHARE